MSSPFRHPLATHPAGAILGRRRDGRPVFAIAGGSGEGAPAPAPAAPPTPAPPAPSVPPTPAPAPAPVNPPAPAPAPAAPPAQGEPQDVAGLPEWAQTLIKNTRAEAADWRTKAQGTAPQAPANPDPANPVSPAAPPQAPAPEGDVNRLPRWAQQAVTGGQDATRQLAVQTAVIQQAPAVGADVARLLDSQAAMTALAAVDPADAAAVQQAITATLATHPHLAAQYGPSRSGADFGTTNPGERKAANLSDAIAARLAAS
ncbi:hypothetical protein [Streptomyces sp. NPDC059631]|uniref:hypothetical protein n=1 Tax=unclassified Streptomyces TaxID=2593676 RepID=UPI0036918ED7